VVAPCLLARGGALDACCTRSAERLSPASILELNLLKRKVRRWPVAARNDRRARRRAASSSRSCSRRNALGRNVARAR
jgi:hypothetical protein